MSDLTTVAETSVFIAMASRIMSDAERAQIVDIVAARPDAGVIITGSKGYHSPGFPAVLLWVFAKNEADDLTAAQLKRLVSETDGLIEDFGGR
jgi:hypothetical protein